MTRSATIAWRSSPNPSDVRSVDSRSGSIGKIRAGVYTEVVFWRAWSSMGLPGATSASTSAIATRIRVAPSGLASETDNWSRSRLSSLSMEHQRRLRRSRTCERSAPGPTAFTVSGFAASACATAARENSASRP